MPRLRNIPGLAQKQRASLEDLEIKLSTYSFFCIMPCFFDCDQTEKQNLVLSLIVARFSFKWSLCLAEGEPAQLLGASLTGILPSWNLGITEACLKRAELFSLSSYSYHGPCQHLKCDCFSSGFSQKNLGTSYKIHVLCLSAVRKMSVLFFNYLIFSIMHHYFI